MESNSIPCGTVIFHLLLNIDKLLAGIAQQARRKLHLKSAIYVQDSYFVIKKTLIQVVVAGIT